MSRMLGEVVEQAGLDRYEIIGDDVTIGSVVLDSRLVTSGSLFCCLRGGHSMGTASPRPQAPRCERVAGRSSAGPRRRTRRPRRPGRLVVGDTRRAMGRIAAAFHGTPAGS